MDTNLAQDNQGDDEEEYVLLNLDGVLGQVDIPPNAPYTLSGLDTLNPVLVIGDKVKLIGEYEETIGTCIVFSESDSTPVVHEETGPSEMNLFTGKCIVDPNKASAKKVKPVTRLQKILKFSLSTENETQEARAIPADQACEPQKLLK